MNGVFAGLEAALGSFRAAHPDWHLELRGVNDAWYARINPTASGTSGDYAANASTPAGAVQLAAAQILPRNDAN